MAARKAWQGWLTLATSAEWHVVLDVVYNHLGPEGNYLADFGPYFTDQYRTPWGQAINFDGAGSDEVVRYFTENALYWVDQFHIDALRLDAIHGITDRNAQPFLKLLAQSVHDFARQAGRQIHLIAESDFNDARFIRPVGSRRLRHRRAVERRLSSLRAHAADRGSEWVLPGFRKDRASWTRPGRRASSIPDSTRAYRRCRHGNSSRDIPPSRFVVFTQNHDQVGNRPLGDRLSTEVCFEIAEAGGRNDDSLTLYSSAFHGRGIWRAGSVPLLHQPYRSGFDRSRAARPSRGVCCLRVAG